MLENIGIFRWLDTLFTSLPKFRSQQAHSPAYGGGSLLLSLFLLIPKKKGTIMNSTVEINLMARPIPTVAKYEDM